VAGLVVVGATAAAGSAHDMQNTKMRFKLDAQEVTVGDDVTGTVQLFSKGHHHGHGGWTPMPDVTLQVKVDGQDVGTVVTDAAGTATVAYTTDAEGDHVMKVAYAGDETHRRRQRAQGFTVQASG
jgi:hypothetical protein